MVSPPLLATGNTTEAIEDSRKKSIARMTSIFVVVEAVFVYYASGIFLFSTSPKMQFKYLPGYGYIIKTFFYYF